jgi:phosphocarrier protein HPr
VNGKSIMGVMMLAASNGSSITIHAEGDDAKESIDKLEQLIKDRFGEDE